MTKGNPFFTKLKLWYMKENSVSPRSLLRFIFIFLRRFLLFYVPIYLSIRLTLPGGTPFSLTQWWASVFGSIMLVFISYFEDNSRDRKKNKTIESDKIIYDCIGGAIQELHEIIIHKPKDGKHYIDEILVAIEKVIITIFKGLGRPCGDLCVNLMVKEGNYLVLTKFATKLQDRDKPKILLDENNPLPGAPAAWALKKTIYINNIHSEEYKPFFQGAFKFKSFISIPVLDDGKVFCIINVDSSMEDQFDSEEFISKKIMTKINPLLLLFVLENELFKKNKKKVN